MVARGTSALSKQTANKAELLEMIAKRQCPTHFSLSLIESGATVDKLKCVGHAVKVRSRLILC
jgi:hypothetical protein